MVAMTENTEYQKRERAIKEIDKLLEGKDYFTEKLSAKYMLNFAKSHWKNIKTQRLFRLQPNFNQNFLTDTSSLSFRKLYNYSLP